MPEKVDRPPTGIVPVGVAGDTTLLSKPGLVISVGSVRVWPQGFEFTLTMLGDISEETGSSDLDGQAIAEAGTHAQ